MQTQLIPASNHGKTTLLVLALTLLMSACTSVPETIVKTPLTAKPTPRTRILNNSGSIYQTQLSRPLFEDRISHAVGDIVTINIVESTSASKSGVGSSSKTGNINSLNSAIGIPVGFKATSSIDNQDKSNTSASNNFSGSIGVTVIEVLENGNLVVSGEKEIALDRGSEYVRFSGVINPDFIKPGNTIASNQVTDAKVEYRTGTHIDTAQIMTFVQRAFMSILPF